MGNASDRTRNIACIHHQPLNLSIATRHHHPLMLPASNRFTVHVSLFMGYVHTKQDAQTGLFCLFCLFG
jgi:hypothetical protein